MYYQPKNNLLDHKRILITGASEGIGRQAALTYAHHGASVLLLGRTEHKLNIVQNLIAEAGGRKARVLVFDLANTQLAPYQGLAQILADECLYLDGLLNNAGILGEIAPMAKQDATLWSEVIAVNINGTFMLTQALLPLLLNASSPSLIFSTSSVGRKGRATWGAYAVSKFATEGMMQIFAEEYTAATLRVNAINPGRTRTNMRAKAFPMEAPDQLKNPADIMAIYLYLMGDDSRHKTGVSFNAQSDVKQRGMT
ncbi:YciK family oxidoreductase [secondary endosymbiont of Ctenarytaina eucalypti]|uniref:Short-chain alcohol dehydrogenase n=1 Tax=secondary endosymbiont of Ctenarytaina eucalypti TaxID=1199245 RepID=J3YR34_9ENTR|nr:YciK family oxidoreductase [secondary endosymbiont of Ctenarytaina eucalypti]AFP84448.1 dehydrogenase of unknown specificity, short-chain alcohol dehydrogenase like protein [secondary endosymbiont of Ctenarytaina eucalypti]